jgi:predicted nucleotidyltransferase
MTKTEALTVLEHYADPVRKMGATAPYLYGSTARNEAGETSDLDLFIDYDRRGRFNALDLVGIKLFLEESLHLPVDLTTRDSLHPRLRDGIVQSAIRIF